MSEALNEIMIKQLTIYNWSYMLFNNESICQCANMPIGCAVYRMALAYWHIGKLFKPD